MVLPEIYSWIYYKKNIGITFIRVSLLITTICTDLFRIVLGCYIEPGKLQKELRDYKADLKPKLNAKQIQLLYPITSNNILTPSDLDLAVMYKILRFVCKIPPHARGWGKIPLRRDASIGACLDIIRLKRDRYYHKPEVPTDDKEFQTTWEYMRSAVVELERHFIGGNLFKNAVDDLYTLDVSKVHDALKQHKDKRVESIFFDVVGFANLLEEIAESIPNEKLNDMKEWIMNLDNNDNFMDVETAATPKVCLNIMRGKKLLQPTDVLCLQFILKKIGCETQFRKCVEYAQKNNALCYHEIPQANGSRLVHVHVRGNLTDYDQRVVEEMKQKFVDILQCNKEEVQVGGICPSTSFFLMLSIRTAHVMKLLKMEQQDKDNLSKLNIDFIIVDLNVVFLGPLKDLGTKWNIYFEPKCKLRWKEGHTYDQPLEPKITELLSQKLTSTQKDIERKLDDDLPSEEMKMELGIKKEAIKDLQEDSLSLHHIHAVKAGKTIPFERVDNLEEAHGGQRKRTGHSVERQLKEEMKMELGIKKEEMKMELGIKKDDMEKSATSIKEHQERVDNLEEAHGGKGKRLERSAVKQPKERVDNLEEAPGGKRKRPERSAVKLPKVIFMEDTFVPPSSANLTSTFAVPNSSAIDHIAYVKPGSLWVAGDSTLMQIDFAGNLIQTVDDALCYHGCFAVTENGDLFYIGKDQHSIRKKSSVETSTIVDLPNYVFICCICISQKKGNLLVVTRNYLNTQRHRVVRYDINENISHVVLDDSIGDPYKDPVYITENRNGDIVVSDQENNAVIVVNSAGQNRFIIKTRDSGFLPCGLATDDTGNILVVEGHKETYIYVFDQEGILTQRLSEKRDRWWGVCLDDKHNLYVGNRKGKIDVYSY